MGGRLKKSSDPEVCGWPGLIESLARICEECPVDRKILLVASHHAGQLILQSLARRSGGWLNLRAPTPAELAWEAIAADASAKGLAAADDITLEDIVIEAYHATRRSFFPEEPPLGLFAAIQRTLLEIRNAGITPEQLRASPRPSSNTTRQPCAAIRCSMKRISTAWRQGSRPHRRSCSSRHLSKPQACAGSSSSHTQPGVSLRSPRIR